MSGGVPAGWGKPLLPISDDDAKRFWAGINAGEASECWPSAKAGRYGSFRLHGRSARSHRVAYALHYGVDPGDKLVCHRCDNPPCCNPSHLFLGTFEDNARDMCAKGRNVRPERDESAVNYVRGERSNFARLTENQVREIRRRRAAGEGPVRLSQEFAVDRTLIWQIVNRKVWSHVA